MVEPFRTRQLADEYPYVWVDATYHKVRVDWRVVKSGDGGGGWGDRRRGAARARHRCGSLGRRRLLDGVPAQSGPSRPAGGVRLVISDAHEELKQAIDKVLSGASWHCWRWCPTVPVKPLRRSCVTSSRNRTIPAPWCNSKRSACSRASRRRRRCSLTRLRTCWPISTFRPNTGPARRARTRSSGSTRRSSGGRTWLGSSRIHRRCYAWSGRS